MFLERLMGFVTAASACACASCAEGDALLPCWSEQQHRSPFGSLSSLGPGAGFAIIAGIPVPFPGPTDPDRPSTGERSGVAAIDGVSMGTAVASGGSRPAPALLSHPTPSRADPPQAGTGRAPDTAEPVSGAPLRPPAAPAGSDRASCPAAVKTALKLPLSGKR